MRFRLPGSGIVVLPSGQGWHKGRGIPPGHSVAPWYKFLCQVLCRARMRVRAYSSTCIHVSRIVVDRAFMNAIRGEVSVTLSITLTSSFMCG